jgi:hypothetical protein
MGPDGSFEFRLGTTAVSSMIGEVTKTEFTPVVLPAFDDAFKVVVRRVAASWLVPSLDPGEVTVSKLIQAKRHSMRQRILQ